MEIKKEKKPQNLMEITVELSTEETKSFYDQALQELAKETNIKGFRPGKAPLNLVKEEISETKVLEKTAEKAINEKYPEILEKENLNPVAPPEAQIQKIAPNNPLVFKLIVPLMPKVELGNYKKIKIKKEKPELKEDEVEKAVNELRSIKGKEVSVNRESKEKDKMKVDLDLSVDKVPIEGGQIKDFSLIIGEDRFLPGLSENLKGLKKGDEKDFSHQYPNDHYDKKLAGKKVDFKAKVKDVYQVELPKLDDEFAQSMGPFKNLTDLKDKIKENIQKEKERQIDQKKEIELLEKLIEQSKFEDIPEVLIDHETNKMIMELKGNIENPNNPNSPKFDDYLKSINKTLDDLKKEFREKALQRIKTAIIIKKIAEKENIKATKEEIEKEIEKLEKAYQGQEKILENIKSEAGKKYLENMITNQKTIDWIKNNSL